jgi:tRNA (guanine26-N2/guanine27-N2)-dimethyltransferase
MWAGPLHNHDFVERVKRTVNGLDEVTYPTRPRMQGMLNLALEVHLPDGQSNGVQELDVPFYRTAQDLSRTMKITSPSLDVIWSALKTAGYNVSSTHCYAGAFKTDAPHSFLWDMMKAWVFPFIFNND